MKKRTRSEIDANSELASDEYDTSGIRSGVVKAGMGAAGVAFILSPPPVKIATVAVTAGGWFTNRWIDYQLTYQEGQIRQTQADTEQVQARTTQIQAEQGLVERKTEQIKAATVLVEKQSELVSSQTTHQIVKCLTVAGVGMSLLWAYSRIFSADQSCDEQIRSSLLGYR